MFTLDERLKGLPAVKEQVVQLYQSLNQPHLAIPGRKAGPAQSFVLGLRGPSGFAVFVYLYLQDSGECAVYVPDTGAVPPDRYQSEEADALGFTESMGFIMDNLNFRGRSAEEQDGMIKTLPVFQRDPPPPQVHAPAEGSKDGKPGSGQRPSVGSLGRLFSAFCLSLLALGCAHVPTEKEREESKLHYELALRSMTRSGPESYKEIEDAVRLDPQNAEAWHVKGIVLHNSFGRLEEANKAYQKALELKPDFSECRTNLGNLYMDLKRYDDAIAEYEKALNDVLYPAQFIAHGNMGYAYFRKGDSPNAINHLKASITLNPKYCLGYLQLGSVYEAGDQMDEACAAVSHALEACPDAPDALQRDGLCQARKGESQLASQRFTACIEKAPGMEQKDQCRKLKEQLTP